MNQQSDDQAHHFASTQMQAKHESVVAEEQSEIERSRQIPLLEKFHHTKNPSTPSITPKSIKKKRSSKKAKAPKLSLGELVRNTFAQSRLSYFSGDQTKIDDFLKNFEQRADLAKLKEADSSLYTKDEWMHILKHIKSRFPDLNESAKRSLKAITQKMSQSQDTGESIWSQASAQPDLITDEDLRWLYDLNDEQMGGSEDVDECRDESGLFVMTLSQDVLTQRYERSVNEHKDTDFNPSNHSLDAKCVDSKEVTLNSKDIDSIFASTSPNSPSHKLDISDIEDSAIQGPPDSQSQIPTSESPDIEDEPATSPSQSIHSSACLHVPGLSLEQALQTKPFIHHFEQSLDSEDAIVSDSESEIEELIQLTPSKKHPQSHQHELPDYSSFHSFPFAQTHIVEVADLSDLQKDSRIREIIETARQTPVKSPFFQRKRMSPEQSPLKRKGPYKILPGTDEKAEVVISDTESVYSTARSKIEEPNDSIMTKIQSDEDEDFDIALPSSMPENQPSRKRKLLHTTRFQIESNLSFHEYEDKENKIKVRTLDRQPIVVDSDNEVPDSEDDENNVSIIEITREVAEGASEDDIHGDGEVSVLQVPSSPIQGILHLLPDMSSESEISYQACEVIQSPEKQRK